MLRSTIPFRFPFWLHVPHAADRPSGMAALPDSDGDYCAPVFRLTAEHPGILCLRLSGGPRPRHPCLGAQTDTHGAGAAAAAAAGRSVLRVVAPYVGSSCSATASACRVAATRWPSRAGSPTATVAPPGRPARTPSASSGHEARWPSVALGQCQGMHVEPATAQSTF